MKFSSVAVGLLASAGSVLGASLQQVTGFGTNPTNVQMFIYVPDKLATNPAVIVAVCIMHSVVLASALLDMTLALTRIFSASPLRRIRHSVVLGH